MKNSVARTGKNPKSFPPALSENVDEKQDAWPPVITSPLKLVVPLTNPTSFTFVVLVLGDDLGRCAEWLGSLQLLRRSPQRNEHKLPLLALLAVELLLRQARRQQRGLRALQQASSRRQSRAHLVLLPPLRGELPRRPREGFSAGTGLESEPRGAGEFPRAGDVQLQEEPLSEAVLRVLQEPGILFQRVQLPELLQQSEARVGAGGGGPEDEGAEPALLREPSG